MVDPIDLTQIRAERSVARDPMEQEVTISWHRDGYELRFENHIGEVDIAMRRWLADQLRYIAGMLEDKVEAEIATEVEDG